MNFSERLALIAGETERRLNDILKSKESIRSENLEKAVAYSLLDGGKRLRAYLANEFCELCGKERAFAADYACAVEMIHAFSLIHDDLPAMDNDDLRRGKPSNHKAFGEGAAILAGDALALDAFGVVANCKKCSPEQNIEAVGCIANASGSMGMCAGQQLDIDGENRHLSICELCELVDGKTGALFSCACRLGCIAAGEGSEEKSAAHKFGLLLGRAFQITDDLLDIRSTSEILGKTVGKDENSNKSTFPSLLGEDGAEKYAFECISDAKICLSAFKDGESKERLSELCDYILTRKS